MTADNTTQRIISRSVRGEEDFWLVRNLLIETWPITPPDFNWDVRRWDGSYFHNEEAGWDARWGKYEDNGIRLWETEDGRLVGAVHPEGAGEAFLQLHPDYRHIEEEMIAWAEEHLSVPTEDGTERLLRIFVYEYDSPRRSLLERRGYEKTSHGGVIRRLRFGNKQIPRPVIAEGYILRTTRPDDDDCRKIADLFNAAFNRDIHTAKEIRTFMASSPSYRNDLDLVAEAPDGTLAALVGMIYDEVNRYGLFEPVCTHPDHQRRGLAGTLMFEGLHRVRALGATEAYVGTGDQVDANRLYESIGFTVVHKGYIWRKVF